MCALREPLGDIDSMHYYLLLFGIHLFLLSLVLLISSIIIIIIIIIQISKRQLHFIRLNHVLLHLNKLSKDTAFMFTFTIFSSVKLTASKNF